MSNLKKLTLSFIFIVFVLFAILSFFPSIFFDRTIKHFILPLSLMLIMIFDLLNGKVKIHTSTINVLIFFLFWISYSLSSALWSPAVNKTLIYTCYIAVNTITFYYINRFFLKPISIKIIVYSLIAMFVLYQVISIWEIITWNHLPGTKFDIDNFKVYIPSGPFYNRNDFAAVMLLLLPLVMFSLKYIKNKIVKFFLTLSIIISFVSMILQGARIGLIAFIMLTAIFMFFYTSIKTKAIFLASIVLISVFIANSNLPVIKLLRLTATKELVSFAREQQSIKLTSIKIRKELFSQAVDISYESFFCGVGSGGFENTMSKWRKNKTYGVLSAHNYFLEVLSTNGIFITILLLMFFSFWIYDLTKLIKKTNGTLRFLNTSLLFTLIMFLFSSSLPSGIMRYYLYWIVLSIIHLFIVLQKEDLANVEKEFNYTEQLR
jgi:O-antigen ligase